ncbi:hypothetical protein OAC90_00195 [Planktomarina sp.]|nr:hypothetical protein [Planktomarina sp.]
MSSGTQGVAVGALDGCFKERLGKCSFEVMSAYGVQENIMKIIR